MTSTKSTHRPIRSFVRRTGRVTASQKRALDELWPVYGLAFTDEETDLADAFGRDAPCVLEIGFGNGDTLVEMAAADPERNYLGIEVHEPGIGHCLIEAQRAGVDNLRLLRHDALDVLRQMLPDGSLDRVNLYFPDPWPKKRHHKRRIVTPAFLDLIADKLVPGGTLHVATDWGDYAEWIDDACDSAPAFHCVERRLHDGDAPLDRPQTKFERRGLKRGHRITDWRFERLPA